MDLLYYFPSQRASAALGLRCGRLPCSVSGQAQALRVFVCGCTLLGTGVGWMRACKDEASWPGAATDPAAAIAPQPPLTAVDPCPAIETLQAAAVQGAAVRHLGAARQRRPSLPCVCSVRQRHHLMWASGHVACCLCYHCRHCQLLPLLLPLRRSAVPQVTNCLCLLVMASSPCRRLAAHCSC